jgi:hypothetical protein
VRRQVVMLRHGRGEGQPGTRRRVVAPGSATSAGGSASGVASGPRGPNWRIEEIRQGIQAIMRRLIAIEDALGIAVPPMPDALRQYTRELAEVRRQREAAIEASEYEQAAAARDQEKRLMRERGIEEAIWLGEAKRERAAWAERTGREEGSVDAGEVERASQLVERLQAVLREHDIDSGGEPGG